MPNDWTKEDVEGAAQDLFDVYTLLKDQINGGKPIDDQEWLVKLTNARAVLLDYSTILD